MEPKRPDPRCLSSQNGFEEHKTCYNSRFRSDYSGRIVPVSATLGRGTTLRLAAEKARGISDRTTKLPASGDNPLQFLRLHRKNYTSTNNLSLIPKIHLIVLPKKIRNIQASNTSHPKPAASSRLTLSLPRIVSTGTCTLHYTDLTHMMHTRFCAARSVPAFPGWNSFGHGCIVLPLGCRCKEVYLLASSQVGVHQA